MKIHTAYIKYIAFYNSRRGWDWLHYKAHNNSTPFPYHITLYALVWNWPAYGAFVWTYERGKYMFAQPKPSLAWFIATTNIIASTSHTRDMHSQKFWKYNGTTFSKTFMYWHKLSDNSNYYIILLLKRKFPKLCKVLTFWWWQQWTGLGLLISWPKSSSSVSSMTNSSTNARR